MEKLYYFDTYMRETACTVTSVVRKEDHTEVLTDKTIFYPECGGQPGDRGTLGMCKVLDTRKAEDGDSILILEKDADVNVGDFCALTLDWEHRHKFMAIHTAQHMLSGMLFTMFGIGTVAVHHGEEYLTIETDQSEISQQTVDCLVATANRLIMEDHPVGYRELSHKEAEELGLRRSIKVDGDVRIVEIKGVDRIACGGVHVASTSEIRLIYCIGREQIRGHVRLYFKCGDDALNSAISSYNTISSLCSKLSCKPQEVEPLVEKAQSDLSKTKYELEKANKLLARYDLQSRLDANNVAVFISDGIIDLASYQNAVTPYDDIALCIVQLGEERSNWLIALKGKYESVNFNDIRSKLLPTINAKGGGRYPTFQGMAACTDKKALQEFLKGFASLL